MQTRTVLRMAAPFVGLSVLVLFVGGLAAWYVHRVQAEHSELLAWNVTSVRAAEELEIGIREVRTQLFLFLLTGDRKHLDAVAPLRRDTDQWLREAERLATTPYEQDKMAQVRRGYEHFFREFRQLAEAVPGGGLPDELRALIDRVLTKEILEPAHEYLAFNEEVVARGADQSRSVAGELIRAALLLGVCGAVAGVIAGVGISRALQRSLRALRGPIQAAAGKLSAVGGPVPLGAGWDFQGMEVALHKIAGEVGSVVERLQQTEQDALRAEQLAVIGQLAGGLAQELRKPLASLRALVQAGGDRAALEGEIGRLEGLIQSFLDFARLPRPEKSVFELGELLEQTVAVLAGRAREQGTRVQCVVSEKPLLIEADPEQLRQVLLHLLRNALEAVGKGGKVLIEATRHGGHDSPVMVPAGGGDAGPPGWLALRVADTGPGLPAELRARIFEPFVSTKKDAAGLGLSICRRIVEAHGGMIAAATRPEGGALFTVQVPLPDHARADH